MSNAWNQLIDLIRIVQVSYQYFIGFLVNLPEKTPIFSLSVNLESFNFEIFKIITKKWRKWKAEEWQ